MTDVVGIVGDLRASTCSVRARCAQVNDLCGPNPSTWRASNQRISMLVSRPRRRRRGGGGVGSLWRSVLGGYARALGWPRGGQQVRALFSSVRPSVRAPVARSRPAARPFVIHFWRHATLATAGSSPRRPRNARRRPPPPPPPRMHRKYAPQSRRSIAARATAVIGSVLQYCTSSVSCCCWWWWW